MPIRSRSHELEDESIERFKSSIPRRWVCREKGRDYGVDLEVEIFAEDRTATGLMFYVQLKATDDAKRERKTSMDVDRIEYLNSLSLPAVVIRYCAPTGRLFWMWDYEALHQAYPPAKTATLSFTNEWSIDTPDSFAELLRVTRRINERRQNELFALSVKYETGYGTQLTASRALNEVIGSLGFIRVTDDENRVPLSIAFHPDHARITLWRGYLELPVGYETSDNVLITLAFALSAVLMRAGFSDRAATAANFCLSLGDVSTVMAREISVYACIALRGEPLKATRLAVQAGIHREQDEAFLSFTTELKVGHSASQSEVAAAIQAFYLPAIEVAPTDESRGAICYSLANVRSNNEEHAKAVEAYNRARKLRPQYLASDYYLNELGGAFFRAGKFRCSAIAYRRASKITTDENTAYCLGDALLYSGEFAEASSILERVAEGPDTHLAVMALLKSILADWFNQNGTLPKPNDFQALAEHADKIGPTDDKLLSVLASAFAAPASSFLWSWAIQLSVIAKFPYIFEVLVCAEQSCGSEPYSMCRERMLSIVETESDLQIFDDLHIEARDLVASRPRRPYTARLLSDNGMLVMTRRL